MHRFILISLFALGTVASVSAGLIPLTGQTTNVSGFGISGNTSGTYFVSGNCAGLPVNGPGFNGCATATAAQASKRNYNLFLFEGATDAGPNPVPDAALPVPASGQLSSGFSSGALFDLMNSPLGAFGGTSNANFYTTSTNNPSVVVPVGIYNVTAVDTMINDYWSRWKQ